MDVAPSRSEGANQTRTGDSGFATRASPASFGVLLVVYATLAIPYLTWRATVVNWDVWFGPVLYLAELYGVISTALFLWVARVIIVPRHRPASSTSTVDALVCTCNEPLAVLEATLRGASAVRGVRRVLVLDDGDRDEVRRVAGLVGASYFARRDRSHAKAGNLNHGLLHSDAEFLLLLDADHVPSPAFLSRTLGHLDDPRVAFVQTPQTYHNRDSFLFRRRRRGGWWSEQGMFYDCIQPAKNRSNSAFFVGTSAVMRRAALDSIGGFATGTATEDIHTSLRLHARGWRSVFVPETLAYGLEAENLKEFYRQRRRWAAGSLGLLVRSPDSPLRARGLTAGQRLSYLSATLAHLQGPQRMVFILTPVLCVLTSSPPVTGNLTVFLVIAIGYTAFGVYASARFARGTYHLVYTECYALANAIAQCSALVGVILVDKKFSVSRKSVRRREPTWVKPLLWILTAIAATGATVAIARLILGSSEIAPLLIGAGLVSSLNLMMLGCFLVFLGQHERRPSLVSLAEPQIPQAKGRRRRAVEARMAPSLVGPPPLPSPGSSPRR